MTREWRILIVEDNIPNQKVMLLYLKKLGYAADVAAHGAEAIEAAIAASDASGIVVQIAERLTLSVRTVESHVYRAMSKTGTTTRDELAALLPRRGERTQ